MARELFDGNRSESTSTGRAGHFFLETAVPSPSRRHRRHGHHRRNQAIHFNFNFGEIIDNNSMIQHREDLHEKNS